MLKINIGKLSQQFADGIRELQKTMYFDISTIEAVDILSEPGEHNALEARGGLWKIKHQNTPSFYKGFAHLLTCYNDGGSSVSFDNDFENLGIMIDCSRNAVLSVEGAKKMIRYLALLGYNSIMLYTEDTIEVEGYPYFGYMRGRYSKAEIKEIENYCSIFGIELIPCIQTLAHLNQAFTWSPFRKINDTGDILLIDSPETYEFLDKYIKTCSECFSTRTIHIGMDEAHMVGLGKYLDENGYTNRIELMVRHLKKVMEICQKYGLKPMMWSDMFYTLIFGSYYNNSEHEIDEETLAGIPKDISLVYWDYYSHDENRYDSMFKSHLKFGNEIIFAGGAWTWKGFVPDNAFSITATKAALAAARKNGIKKVFATLWGDDGGECPFLAVLPTLAVYSEENYHIGVAERNFFNMTGISPDDFMKIDLPAKFPDIPDTSSGINPSKYLLFQDLLGGLFDKNYAPVYVTEKYIEDERTFIDLTKRTEGDIKKLFNGYAALCSVLEIKAELGANIRTYYKNGEINKLREICKNIIPKLIEKTESLYEAVKEIWLLFNKPYGIEVLDVRYGGLIQRFKTTASFIDDYICDKTDSIPLLDEEILPYCAFGEPEEYSYVYESSWKRMFTANVISH